MRQILAILLLVLFPAMQLWAQTPQLLNYQAVARNSTGQIIPSQNVGVRFSVLEGGVNGAELYKETHSTTTNNFGLFTLFIGGGTVATGTFNSIDWATGTKFLKVEIAPAGGTNYTVQGTTQLLSVPYALYAEKTKLLAGNNTIAISNGNTITGNYQAGNNTIAINGNNITGNYQPANNTIAITGNTIAGNYQPGNNTVAINGNNITGNYQAGTGINLTGNVISHNLQAGSGISITGNTISSTAGGNNLWQADAAGIRNVSGNVGIRQASSPTSALSISGDIPGVLEGNAADFNSSSPWHTAITFTNSNVSPAGRYSFSLGGSGNTEVGLRNFGLINHNNGNNTVKWSFIVNGITNNIGIGMKNFTNAEQAKSRLHIFSGDVNIDEIGSGIILKSPNGNCWRITIDNAGNLVRTAITCP